MLATSTNVLKHMTFCVALKPPDFKILKQLKILQFQVFKTTSNFLNKNNVDLLKKMTLYLRPEGPPCTCSQESSTGGGMAVEIVVVLMSPMMPRASLRAWYMRSISSLC